MSVSKTWCFTLNNWTQPELDSIMNWDNTLISRSVFGRETGQSGTHHLQGYVTFRSSQRLSSLKKLLPRAHWEISRCAKASERYCMKDGKYTVLDFRRSQTIGSPLVTVQRPPTDLHSNPDIQTPSDILFKKLQPNLKLPKLF